jgi:glycosyltransferase involved in cell wall biosynthesis
MSTPRENVVKSVGSNVATEPAVSVIMPAYNVAPYIGEALDSAFAQTFKNYEVIVVNDGSPDSEELERVLAPYRDRIVYIVQENRGLAGARNTAIRVARGEFIALLDSDDAWEPDYLKVQIEMMRSDPSIDVLYSDARIFGDGEGVGRTLMDMCPSEGEVTFERMLTQECNVLICATARRATVIRVGMFDESLRSSEDFDLWLRIIKSGGRIAYHRQILARYRRRPSSLSADPVWMCEHILQVFDKTHRTMTLVPHEREVLERQRARFHAMLSLHEGKRAFAKGDYPAAIQNLTEANSFLKKPKIKVSILMLRSAPGLLRWVYHLRNKYVFHAEA